MAMWNPLSAILGPSELVWFVQPRPDHFLAFLPKIMANQWQWLLMTITIDNTC